MSLFYCKFRPYGCKHRPFKKETGQCIVTHQKLCAKTYQVYADGCASGVPISGAVVHVDHNHCDGGPVSSTTVPPRRNKCMETKPLVLQSHLPLPLQAPTTLAATEYTTTIVQEELLDVSPRLTVFRSETIDSVTSGPRELEAALANVIARRQQQLDHLRVHVKQQSSELTTRWVGLRDSHAAQKNRLLHALGLS